MRDRLSFEHLLLLPPAAASANTHQQTRTTQVAANIITHLERSGAIGAAQSPPGGDPKPFVKDIWGMGSAALGLMVVCLATVMVLTRDAFHGTVRLALAAFGGPQFDSESLSWEATYGDLLRKIGKHPDGGSQLSAAAIGGSKGGGGGGGGSGGGGGGSGGSGSGSGILRERGRSANRDDEEATRSLLGGDGSGGGGGRGVLEMVGTGGRSA